MPIQHRRAVHPIITPEHRNSNVLERQSVYHSFEVGGGLVPSKMQVWCGSTRGRFNDDVVLLLLRTSMSLIGGFFVAVGLQRDGNNHICSGGRKCTGHIEQEKGFLDNDGISNESRSA